MNEFQTIYLLSLVDELLLNIVEQVDSKKDLSSLSRTCSRFCGLVEPVLYRTLLIRTGKDAINLTKSIHMKPDRASAIRNLQIRYRKDDADGVEILNSELKKMSQLRHLHLESPCPNDSYAHGRPWFGEGKIDYTQFFKFASSMSREPQPRVQIPLQTLVLHSHGNECNKYTFVANAIMLLHPTLQNLTLACFDITGELEKILEGRSKFSSLKNLIFDECNFTHSGLDAILSTPKALERLTLGERIYHTSSSHSPLATDTSAMLSSLRWQQDSLQYLKHTGGYCRVYPPTDLSLAFLSAVREIEVHIDEWLQKLYNSLSSPGQAPPSLQTLRILAPRYCDPVSMGFFLVDMAQRVQNIPQIDLVCDHPSMDDPKTAIEHLWSENSREQLDKVVTKLAKRGVKRLRIFLSIGWHYIPPFMLGEEVPEESLAFDSAAAFVSGRIAAVGANLVVDQPVQQECRGRKSNDLEGGTSNNI